MERDKRPSEAERAPSTADQPVGPSEGYWTQRRLDLLGWFERNAPGLGRLYAGAVEMVSEPRFPGRTRFVAHAVREIRNRLPGVLARYKGGAQLQYKNQLDDIEKEWRRSGFPADGGVPAGVTQTQEVPSGGVPVPRRLFLMIASLVRDHAETREKPMEAAIRLFQSLDPHGKIPREKLLPLADQWLDATDWFERMVHNWKIRDEEVDTQQFQKRFELFEATVGAMVRAFFATVAELDEILEQANR